MKQQNHYWAIQAELSNGRKLLCWQEKKHIYFGESVKGYAPAPPPTLYNTRKEAKTALDSIPSKGANVKQFQQLVKAEKVHIVKLGLRYDYILKANKI